MRLEIRELQDAADWNDRVERMGGSVHYTSEWVSFTARRGRLMPLLVDGNSPDGEVAAVVYIAIPARWPLSRWPTAQMDALPIGNSVGLVLGSLEELLREMGSVALEVGSFAAPATISLAPFGYSESQRLEFVLRLDDGIQSVWDGLRKTLRNEIRRFESSGSLCTAGIDERCLVDFRAIEKETIERHRSQGKSYAPTSRETLELLWREILCRDRGRAYFAVKDGVAVATAVVGSCGPRVYLLYTGSTRVGLDIHASKGLLWHVLKQEHQRGGREFNFGGMPSSAADPDSVDHGLYRFKMGFGAQPRLCISGRKILRPFPAKMREAALAVRGMLRRAMAPQGS